ncbi:alternative ribosome rescue aminoacyl-tRNA hydrolase ArfB [uncultured Winogradskyella sp.]|uniref:alternative ribosome rescue aminoacyl-tRNA hydrolase ArfB n=1 Tax=uncultured Winogradskyella sp. TaxID=395353 RepID=UPI0026390EA1|nr:alternative ribosome rescue aminoacyl-tRNA hydrolase ArfB [uncultured Winogradskyella sp.]
MDADLLKSELSYKYVRSSGSGGQNVNKVSSKAELYFNLQDSQVFNKDEKLKLSEFFSKRLTKEGILILACDESRSQFRNKAIVTHRFLELIDEGLKEEKERIKTKIPKAVKRKRLANKRKTSEKKANRKPPETD